MPAQTRTRRELLTTLLGIALCLAVTAGLLCLYFWSERRHAAVLLFALLVPALWAYPFYLRIRKIVAGRHFSRAELVLDTHRPGLGQPVRVQLTLSARRTLELEGRKLVLRAVETVRTGRRKTRTRQVARVAVPVTTPDKLVRDEPQVFEGEITVPADSMESFQGHNVSLCWVLEAYALLGKVSVLLDQQELVVRPVRSGTRQGVPEELAAGNRLLLRLQPGSLQVGSKGHIDVAVTDELTIPGSSLAVGVSWQTRTADGHKGQEHSVFAETVIEIAPGEPVGFDFLVPPAGPMSYAGKLFAVTWTAKATLYSADGATVETTAFPVTVGPQQG